MPKNDKPKVPPHWKSGNAGKRARRAKEAEARDPEELPAEPDEEEPESEGAAGPAMLSATALARAALDGALTARIRARIETEPGLALVIAVPTAAWVKPVSYAAKALADWAWVEARSGADRKHRPSEGNQEICTALTSGQRVLGVSPDPRRFLPATLMAGADIHVRICQPSNRVIADVIETVTGRRPARLPPGSATGLDFFDIASAIRPGATARSCVERLAAARRSRAHVDPLVASAPPLSELHGYGEAMVWCRALVDGLERWRRGELPFPTQRTAVFAGETGLGKTSLVRSLARSAGLPLISTSVSAWFAQSPGFLDSIVKACDENVAAARSFGGPSIFFLDELDGIPDRKTISERGRDWWNPVILHVMLTVEALAREEIVLVAATNFPDRIDEALLRPGRFGRLIRIGRPDLASLPGIMRMHLGNDLPDLDLAPLASLAVGMTGAEVMDVVTRARGRALQEHRPLAALDLYHALAPDEERSPADLRLCALHEAGHAVAAWVLGIEVRSVSIVQRLDSAGRTITELDDGPTMSREDIERHVIVSLAGRAADVTLGRGATTGAARDLEFSTRLVAAAHLAFGLGDSLVRLAGPGELAGLLAADPEVRRLVHGELERLHARAVGIVRSHRRRIEAVAEALAASRHLDAQGFRRIVAGGGRRARPRSTP